MRIYNVLTIARIPLPKFYLYSCLCIAGYFIHTHIIKNWYDEIYQILPLERLPIPTLVKEASLLLKEMSFVFYVLAIGISADTDIILLKMGEHILNQEFLFIGILFFLGAVLLPLIYLMMVLPFFTLLRLVPLYYAPRNYSTLKELEEIKEIWRSLGFSKKK